MTLLYYLSTTAAARYLGLLSRARVVVTANPGAREGDHRTWEALASGAAVVVDRMFAPLELSTATTAPPAAAATMSTTTSRHNSSTPPSPPVSLSLPPPSPAGDRRPRSLRLRDREEAVQYDVGAGRAPLVAALRRLIEDPAAAYELARAGRRAALSRHTMAHRLDNVVGEWQRTRRAWLLAFGSE